MVNHIRVFYIF